ncbi:TPA: hypothetical protein JG914_004839, partial [Enterobacter hormaechei subsp. steigerwaltii]|nr:hypothetical protein [Enterobacter hormaechei subsp. steigerwaltii]
MDNAATDGIASNAVRVSVTDANGNPLAGQSVSFSADNGATIAASATTGADGTVTQTLTSKTAGDSVVTATVNGSSQSITTHFQADGNSAHIASGALVMTVDGAVADGSAMDIVQATVTDSQGNPVAGVTVDFVADNGASIVAQGTTDTRGQVSVTLSSKTAGISHITATVNGGSQNVDATFVADRDTAQIGAGDLTVVTDNAVANGSAANSIQVKVVDANRNPVEGLDVSFSASNGA